MLLLQGVRKWNMLFESAHVAKRVNKSNKIFGENFLIFRISPYQVGDEK